MLFAAQRLLRNFGSHWVLQFERNPHFKRGGSNVKGLTCGMLRVIFIYPHGTTQRLLRNFSSHWVLQFERNPQLKRSDCYAILAPIVFFNSWEIHTAAAAKSRRRGV
jgi:hypothetical protein